MRIRFVDIDDDIAHECQRRAGDLTWNQLITQSLSFAMSEADARAELARAELAEAEAGPPREAA